MKKKIIAVALAATMCAASMGLAACGGAKKGENELWITYFEGGYGKDWVEQLGAKFTEETGIAVRTDGDTQLMDSVANMMENGTDYDLIFCHDITWEDYVSPGQIYCLDELYNSTVDDKGTTFADRIWDDDVLASARYPDRNGDYHYYKVPWTIGTAGIAYNLTVMDRIDGWLKKKHPDRELWNRTAPVDYYELMQYCEDIVEAGLYIDPEDNTSGKIVPFTWSGASESWQWDYALFDWWGQLAGPETMNSFKNFGNVKSDFTLDTAQQNNPEMDVYNPDKAAVVRNKDGKGGTDGTVNKAESTYVGWKEFKQAYSLWYNLVATSEHKGWSADNIGDMSKYENEQAFASGNAAMTPAACWIEYESRSYLERYGQEVSIMATPIVSHVKFDANDNVLPKDATSYAYELNAILADEGVTEKTIVVNGERYNRVSFTSSFGDSAVIPASSSGRDYAVQFLKFMQKDENAKLFTKLSGGTVLPYKYEYWNAFGEGEASTATAWQKSIFEINRNSTKFNNYTQHPMMRKTNLRGSARMTTIWPKNDYYYIKAWNNPSGFTPQALMTERFNFVKNNWQGYLDSYTR